MNTCANYIIQPHERGRKPRISDEQTERPTIRLPKSLTEYYRKIVSSEIRAMLLGSMKQIQHTTQQPALDPAAALTTPASVSNIYSSRTTRKKTPVALIKKKIEQNDSDLVTQYWSGVKLSTKQRKFLNEVYYEGGLKSYVPIWNTDTNTVRALVRKGVIILGAGSRGMYS